MANHTWLCLPAPCPLPALQHYPLLFKRKKKDTKKTFKKNSMFPNLHDIFYHMMCLAFRK